MEKEIQVRDAKVYVSKSVLDNRTKEERAVEEYEETVEVCFFITNPASVSVKAGATVNLGGYESGRIDVMLSMPCYCEKIDQTFEYVKDWVDTRMAKEYAELKKVAGSR